MSELGLAFRGRLLLARVTAEERVRQRRCFAGVRPAPVELLVGARVHDGLAAADLHDLRRQLVDEVPIVRHDDERAAVVDEGVQQHVLRVDVEVVRRLVEEQRVGRTQQHPRDGQARPLAARQDADPLVGVVAREQEPAEDVADHRDHLGRRARRQRLVHRQGRDPGGPLRPARSTASRPGGRPRACPVSGSSTPDNMRISVDLPEPFGPTSAMRSPRSMSRLMPSKTRDLAVRLAGAGDLEDLRARSSRTTGT